MKKLQQCFVHDPCFVLSARKVNSSLIRVKKNPLERSICSLKCGKSTRQVCLNVNETEQTLLLVLQLSRPIKWITNLNAVTNVFQFTCTDSIC